MSNRTNADSDRLRGYKVEIYPSDDQKEIIHRSLDISRAVYNMALEMQIANYNSKESFFITYNEMCKKVSYLRNNDPDYTWLNGCSIGTIRETLIDADTAFTKFFSNQNRFPRFKSKKRSKKTFGVRSDRCEARGKNIYISGIGLVDAKSHIIPQYTRLRKTRITFDGYDRYYFSCTIERDVIDINIAHPEPIGIDVGIRNMITTSDGDIYKLSDTSKLNKRLNRLKRRAQKHYNYYISESKRMRTKYEDVPKSKNMQKINHRIFKTHRRITNKKLNDIHYATKQIVDKNPSSIVIEDLSLSRMRQTIWIRPYLPQVVFREIHRQLEYKAADRGIPVIKVPKDYPSSQICSRCGSIRKTHSSVYICKHCGLRIDRDINAAYNLRNFGADIVNSTYEIIA